MLKKTLKNKRIIFFIFLSGAFLILKITIENFLLNFPYFKIEKIDFKDRKLSLNYLMDKSIFNINLKNISKELASNYPEFKEIILNFQFPSKLIVETKEHTPIARLILNKDFFVDEEAKIFLRGEDSDLPVITGLQNRIFSPQPYKKYPIQELLLSLDLIKKSLPFKIKRIDARRKEEITFFLDNGLKIKIGDRDYFKRLETLSLVMKELKETKNIDYIDLRFSNPIVKYK